MKPDKTNKSQSEVMDLRATIVVLRERLEILTFDKDKAVQRAVLLSSDEIQQLKDMRVVFGMNWRIYVSRKMLLYSGRYRVLQMKFSS